VVVRARSGFLVPDMCSECDSEAGHAGRRGERETLERDELVRDTLGREVLGRESLSRERDIGERGVCGGRTQACKHTQQRPSRRYCFLILWTLCARDVAKRALMGSHRARNTSVRHTLEAVLEDWQAETVQDAADVCTRACSSPGDR
jgi:hypothetical protein